MDFDCSGRAFPAQLVWNANVGLTAPSSAYAESQSRATTYHTTVNLGVFVAHDPCREPTNSACQNSD